MLIARATRTARMAHKILSQFSMINWMLIVRPMRRKIKEFAKKAVYSQKLFTTTLVVGDMPLGPIFPFTIPAATTASTPLTCRICSPTRKEPKARMVVSVVSISGSSTRLMISEMIIPRITPTTAPPPATRIKSVTLFVRLKSPLMAISSISPNTTIAVPSLKRLSPSSKTCKRLGAPRRRNSATTATGSVAAIKDPNTIAAGSASPVLIETIFPTSNVVMITPGIANNRIRLKSRRKSSNLIWKAASNSKGGTSNPRMSAGEISISNSGKKVNANPINTKPTVYGRRRRFAAIATREAISSNTMMLSSTARNSSK